MNDILETDVEFIRDYNVTIDRLWAAISEPGELVQWFGPEGVDVVACDLGFDATGPWFCQMVGRESGQSFKVSGIVTHTRPPKGGTEGSVGFTWGWHDENDQRGPESHVIFEVSSFGGKARLRLVHRELPDSETAQRHTQGWLSSLACLEAYLTT